MATRAPTGCSNTEPDAGLNGRTLRYPRGKTLGGCSSINGMIYMRGQARDYDQWAQLTGDAAWGWDQALPNFKQHEDHHKGANATARRWAANGAWTSSACAGMCWTPLPRPRSRPAFPPPTDFNQGDNEGVGYFEVNQKAGWRWNTAKAFLRPTCISRPNFELWTSAQVAKLLMETQADGTQRCTGRQVLVKRRDGDGHGAAAR